MATFDEVNRLAARITDAQRKSRAAKHSTIYEPRSTTASSLGYKCERRLVYARTQPEMASPIGDELASIFEEGNLHQADVRRELIELGFEALEAERSFRDEALEIGGRIDGMLPISVEHRSERIPTEIKSCTGTPPATAEEMRVHTGIYGRYFAQMQTYLFLTSSPVGVFLFKDKITGLWTMVTVELDYGYAEELLKKAEHVRDHIKAGTLPDRLADRSECAGCPFNESACLPAEAAIDPLLLVDDVTLIGQLEERELAEPTAKRFKALDDSVKTRFKLTKGTSFVVGNEKGFHVQKKPHGKGVRIDIQRL
jgi:CRISPR/Cas system-associated exonuclease Cas4 (RecB family)